MTDIDYLLIGMMFMLATVFMILDLSRPNVVSASISMLFWWALGLTYVMHSPTIPELGWAFTFLGFVMLIMVLRDALDLLRSWRRRRLGLRPEEEYESY